MTRALGADAWRLAGNANVTNGVLVHLWRGQSTNGIFLLDMTPTTPDSMEPALGVGDIFTDPASGITIAPVWANGTAGVHVTMGGSGGTTCVRKNPTATVSLAQQQGQAGTTLSYAVTVTDTSTGCPAPSYTMQATLAAGWTASMAPSGGAATSMTIQLTSPLSAAVGMYTIAPKIFDTAAPTYSVTTQAQYSVASGGSGGGGAGTFSDDFNRVDSSAVGNGWTAVSGTYGIQGGMAVAQGNLSLAIRASLSGQSTSAQADFVRPTSASGTKFGVVVRYQNPKNYYLCYRMAGGSSVFRVAKVVNGVEYVLKAVSVSQAPLGTPFTVSCSASGNVISVGDGSAVKATATDVAFPSGAVGIQTDKAGLKLDKFSASAQ